MPDTFQVPPDSTPAEIADATRAASEAFRTYGTISPEDRRRFLLEIAERLQASSEALIAAAHRETHLPIPRLTGELGRARAQLTMFADLIATSEWMDLRFESADPARQPAPKPDLRRTMVPLGPVAVFGASNFPFAFSVPGGDTASALAAGCPVVVKAHPAHPEASFLAGEAIRAAVEACGLPAGTFGLLWGGAEVGQALVLDPNIYAVGFTGSHRAGRALFDLAASRDRPIPVYAEMGSVNPLFALPGALEARGDAMAEGFVGSLTLGVGQFCTNPGVVVGVASPALEKFVTAVAERLTASSPGTMLTDSIGKAYADGVADRLARTSLTCHASGEGAAPALFSVDAAEFVAEAAHREELFGPAAVVVRCRDLEEMVAVADVLEGQLTATLHFEEHDEETVRTLLPALIRAAGRLVANGFPTGVEVNSAMHHGGPYPATTDSRATSVGTASVLRFVRPVAFQDFPAALLPQELRS